MTTKINVIITGATGMVGEGALHECLQHESIESVLVIGRKSCAVTHPKLKEIIHADFFDLSTIAENFKGYNACFFCLGVSSLGMNEMNYKKLTHTLTMHFAATFLQQNQGSSFCYISGAATDSTEKGKLMWARVKGKTENDLMKMNFKQAFNFRPAFIVPTKGLKNTLRLYKIFGWLIPVIELFSKKYICTLKELATAMINAVTIGYEKQVLEVTDIVTLSKR